MIGIVDLERAEAELAAGELACPGCGGPLRRWGHARAREVRDLESRTLRLRPRRARCGSCGGTHVLLLGAVLPRRADTTAVIGTALWASARGMGYRRIAMQLERPVSTVRRWVRAVRDEHHVEWLREQGIGWIARADREALATLATELTRLGEALSALAAAAVTVRARLTPHVPPWTLIGQFTHGRLVNPASTG
jgi:transposase-like protein